MRLWLALAGGAMLVFAWLALRAPSDVAVPMTMVKATSLPAAPAVMVPTPAALAVPQPRGIRVHGVLLRGEKAAARSEALLSVEGGAAQAFKVGEAVAQGWSLAAVAPDHVMLSHGDVRARIDVTYSVQAPVEQPPGGLVKAVAKGDAKDEPAPGFVPAAAGSPRTGPPGPANLAANAKFRQDMQNRLSGGK
ncbi:MAG: hypothetical protein HY854_05650 [Burkholderiales bacterium]|nr:hypothetical protein [Burkholderiales bacterium]